MKEYQLMYQAGRLEELAQKLAGDDGYPSNIYKEQPELLRKYENKALEIIEKEVVDVQRRKRSRS